MNIFFAIVDPKLLLTGNIRCPDLTIGKGKQKKERKSVLLSLVSMNFFLDKISGLSSQDAGNFLMGDTKTWTVQYLGHEQEEKVKYVFWGDFDLKLRGFLEF